MPEKILFIDRDGTLISEPSQDFQVDNLNKLVFEKNVISSLVELKKAKYKFVMITNQDGLGSEKFPYKDFLVPHEFMINVFLSQGIVFEEILICSHELQDNCKCRKPNIEMVKHWLLDDLLSKECCFVIGDRHTDMILAKNMGIKGIRYGGINGFTWDEILFRLTKLDRYSKVVRNTKETKIIIEVWLDRQGNSLIDTGINMFNHMLNQIAVHGGIRIKIISNGDIHIDDHHTIEDVGIVLGTAILKAIGVKKCGLQRFGFSLPMDESSGYCLLDISGRPFLKFRSCFKYQYIGDMSSEMVKHFFHSLVVSMKCTLHLRSIGNNDHHRLESLFKVFGKTLQQAISVYGKEIPSSKGLL